MKKINTILVLENDEVTKKVNEYSGLINRHEARQMLKKEKDTRTPRPNSELL